MGFSIRPYDPSDLETLLAVWQAAVEATHTFLASEDVARYRPIVAETIPYVETYIAADTEGRAFGFIGLEGSAVSMLFIHPDRHGTGAGSALLALARERYGLLTVDVNEQNGLAHAFYRQRGFRDVARSALDPSGRPFPVIHMAQS